MKIRKVTTASVGQAYRYIGRYFNRMGQQVVYSALLMGHSYRSKQAPLFARNIVIGAFGYLISPLDALPDLTPIFGFTDDLGVLTFGLVTIASYINDDVRIAARKDLKRFFPRPDMMAIQQVDSKL